jgi:hypothetical protein
MQPQHLGSASEGGAIIGYPPGRRESRNLDTHLFCIFTRIAKQILWFTHVRRSAAVYKKIGLNHSAEGLEQPARSLAKCNGFLQLITNKRRLCDSKRKTARADDPERRYVPETLAASKRPRQIGFHVTGAVTANAAGYHAPTSQNKFAKIGIWLLSASVVESIKSSTLRRPKQNIAFSQHPRKSSSIKDFRSTRGSFA